jgi:transcriptional regulator with XRE-family HTH domain
MRFTDLMTDQAVLAELGARLKRQRLERNIPQEEMADSAGIGRATLQRLERGRSVQTGSLVKLLRAFDLLDGLDAVIPERVSLPIAQLEREQRRRPRQRARSGSGSASATSESQDAPQRQWSWGDAGDGQ